MGTRNNTHNTIQQHILLKCVVVGTRNNTHNTIQQHTLLMLLLCVTYEPSYYTVPLYIQVQYVLVSKHPLWGLARFLVYRIRTIYNGRNNYIYIYLHNGHANLINVCIMHKTPVIPTQHSLPTSSWVRTKQKHTCTHGSLTCKTVSPTYQY